MKRYAVVWKRISGDMQIKAHMTRREAWAFRESLKSGAKVGGARFEVYPTVYKAESCMQGCEFVDNGYQSR